MSTPQQSQGLSYTSTGYAPPLPAEPSVAAAGLAQQTSQATTSTPTQSQSRQAAEEARKDRTLAEFMLMLDDYEPLVCEFSISGFCQHH
jgi:transcription initiation factor TFIID subunit 10